MKILISEIPNKKLFGSSIQTSFAKQETSKLWRPFRAKIANSPFLKPKKFYSIQRYGAEMKMGVLGLDTLFEKCAAIEFLEGENPDGFEEINLEGGLYAVFEHKGSALDFQKSLQNFLENWLPGSGYELDSRNHFETFDENYDPFSANSVELVWIPIKRLN